MSADATLEEVIEIATRMAEELQEFVGEAITASGDDDALKGTQDLIEEWESIFRRTHLSWQPEIDHLAGDVEIKIPD